MISRPTADDLPEWARTVVMRGSAAYAATSILSSSIALGMLAWQAGYHDPRAILFGAGFDVAAAVTGTAWAAGREGSWWHYTGRNATLGLFGASQVFNAAEVFSVRGHLPAEAMLVVAVFVSLVFPALALVFGHLYLVAKRSITPEAVQAVPDMPADMPGHAAGPAVESEPAAGADVPARTDDEVLGGLELVEKVTEYVRVARANRNHHGERTIAREFGLTRKDAAEVLAAAKRSLDAPPATNGARVPLPTAGA